jgi:hypothetical protein
MQAKIKIEEWTKKSKKGMSFCTIDIKKNEI